MVVTLGQQYNIGEKPTVILYTYTNRHPETPEKQRKNKTKQNKTWHIVVIYLTYYNCDRLRIQPCSLEEGVTPKQTGNEHGRGKQNKRNKQGRKQTEGSGREISLQRTSSPGRDSEEKTKKQKTNTKQTKDNPVAPVVQLVTSKLSDVGT